MTRAARSWLTRIQGSVPRSFTVPEIPVDFRHLRVGTALAGTRGPGRQAPPPVKSPIARRGPSASETNGMSKPWNVGAGAAVVALVVAFVLFDWLLPGTRLPPGGYRGGDLRAYFVPAGDHQLEFVYRPLPFRVGATLTLAGLVALAALVGVPAARRGRPDDAVDDVAPPVEEPSNRG